MSVWTERKSTGWVVRWDDFCTVMQGGELVRVRRKPSDGPYRSRQLAEIAARELRERLGKPVRRRRSPGGARPIHDVPLETLVEKWGASRLAERAIQPYTLEVYRHVLTRLFKMRSWTTSRDITKAAVIEWRLESNGKGVDRPFSYLRSVLRWANQDLDQWVDPYVLTPPRKPHAAKKAPPGELLELAQVQKLIAAAAEVWRPAGALVHCLSLYGARGASYAKVRVKDYDRENGTLTVWHVKHTDPLRHPLFPETCAWLNEISQDRHPDLHLFTSPWEEAWTITKRGSNVQMENWYRRLARKAGVSQKGIYRLKNFAISNMEKGAPPWPRPLTSKEGILFTGHKLTSSFDGYKRTNDSAMRSLVIPKLSAPQGALQGADILAKYGFALPDDDVISVKYGTFS